MVNKNLLWFFLALLSYFLLDFLFFQKDLFAATTITTTSNQPLPSVPSPDCKLDFGWIPYNGVPLSYGTWDGTYTVFLYRSFEDRDHAVAKIRTSENKAQFSNLVPGQRYTAEVFLTGAFVAGPNPYWDKFLSMPCSYSSAAVVSNNTSPTVVTAATTTKTTPQILPDTGWQQFLVASAGIIFAILGLVLSRTIKLRHTLDRRVLAK